MTEANKLVLPWKTHLTLRLLDFIFDAARRSNGTVNRFLINIFDRQVAPNPNPIDGVYTSDVTVDPSRNLWFRLFVPSSATAAASLPVIVYFHGGGFALLSAASTLYDNICRRFCSSFPAIVVSVNYRLAPEHRCPAQYDDAFDVLKFLDQNGAILPEAADVSKCFLAGDSAGANISHHVAVRVSRERLGLVKIIGLVAFQPFYGGEKRTKSDTEKIDDPISKTLRNDWFWKAFLPVGSNRDNEAINVCGPNAIDISGLDYPNTLVVVAGFDPLQDWERTYYDWLRKSGKGAKLVEYPNMFHVFQLFPELPESSQVISQVKDFINQQISNVSSGFK